MLFLVCFVWIVNTSFAWEIRILNSYEIKEEIKKIELKINYTKNRLKYLNYTNPNYKTQESLYLEVELNELEYYLLIVQSNSTPIFWIKKIIWQKKIYIYYLL